MGRLICARELQVLLPQCVEIRTADAIRFVSAVHRFDMQKSSRSALNRVRRVLCDHIPHSFRTPVDSGLLQLSCTPSKKCVDQVLTNYGVAVRETSSLQEEAASNAVSRTRSL